MEYTWGYGSISGCDCGCVSLAPAREFEVNANCVNFGVSSGDATEILSCVILVLPIDSGDHVDDGDTRWILVSLGHMLWGPHLSLACLAALDL